MKLFTRQILPGASLSTGIMLLWIALMYFTINRIDQTLAISCAGWVFEFITLSTAMAVLFLLARAGNTARGMNHRLAQQAMLISLLAWGASSMVSIALNPVGCDINYRGFCCLLSQGIWFAPLLVIPRLRMSRELIFAVLKFILLCSAVAILVGAAFTLFPKNAIHLMNWDARLETARLFLPLGVPTVIGCLFCMQIPLVFMFLESPENRKNLSRLWLGILLILIAGVTLSGSRASLINMLLILSLCLAFFYRSSLHAGKLLSITALIILSILIAFAIFSDRERYLKFNTPSDEWRLRGASAALDMLRERPLLGSGQERHFHRNSDKSFSDVIGGPEREAILYNNRLVLREPHNAFLFILAENGIVGLALFFMPAAMLLSLLLRQSLSSGKGCAEKYMALSILAALTASLSETFIAARPRAAVLTMILWGLYLSYCSLAQTDDADQNCR